MPSYEHVPRVAMQLSRDVLVASIQVDLDEAVLARFRDELLQKVHATAPRAVVLDVSGVDTLDSAEFASLRRLIAMVTIMGTRSILVGMQPGVVSALVEVNADVDGLVTAIDMDAAFQLLEEQPALADEAGEGDESDEEADNAAAATEPATDEQP
jgi:rsbT antagonist protein RsbS